jgi:hypothetical protein
VSKRLRKLLRKSMQRRFYKKMSKTTDVAVREETGLTENEVMLWDNFAGLSLGAVLSPNAPGFLSKDGASNVAEQAYTLADAMIIERRKRYGKE